MIDLVLCHPPHPRLVYGLTIPTLSGFLCSQGFKVVSMPSPGSVDEVVRMVLRCHPRFVGVSVPFTFLGPSAVELVKVLKKRTHVPVVVGGSHVTVCPDEFTMADYVCRGYGELFLLRLLQDDAVAPGVDMGLLPCILDWGAGEWLVNGMWALRYMGSRGCVFDCSFCSNKLLSGGRVVFRPVELVVRDLMYMRSKGVRCVVFCDETFTLDRDRVMRLCGLLVDKGVGMRWWCQTRANLMDDELAGLMRDAGCVGLSFGVESGDPVVLGDSCKKVGLDDVVDGIGVCHGRGLLCYGGFIVGHPLDTKESVGRSVGFAVESGLDFAGFGVMCPYPGTRVREMALQDGGLLSSDWGLYHAGNVVYVPRGLRGCDLNKMCWWASGRFMWSGMRRLVYGGFGLCRNGGVRGLGDMGRRLWYGLGGLMV